MQWTDKLGVTFCRTRCLHAPHLELNNVQQEMQATRVSFDQWPSYGLGTQLLLLMMVIIIIIIWLSHMFFFPIYKCIQIPLSLVLYCTIYDTLSVIRTLFASYTDSSRWTIFFVDFQPDQFVRISSFLRKSLHTEREPDNAAIRYEKWLTSIFSDFKSHFKWPVARTRLCCRHIATGHIRHYRSLNYLTGRILKIPSDVVSVRHLLLLSDTEQFIHSCEHINGMLEWNAGTLWKRCPCRILLI